MKFSSIAIIASANEHAQRAGDELKERYPHVEPRDADIIVALGGDGFMLQTLHRNLDRGVPIYGMNFGAVGFLMNSYAPDNLFERLAKAELAQLHPLRMRAVQNDGAGHEALAINEVSLLRETSQTAKIRISIDGTVRMEELACDGVLVATPAGSSAYNFSARGPILPIEAHILALTPISAFRPRRWRGALLPHDAKVRFDVIESEKRPVSAVADNREVRDVKYVCIEEDRSLGLTLLFDASHNLAERLLREQFRD
ncbi:MAG: NAD kinase [Sphingomonadales bacterium]